MPSGVLLGPALTQPGGSYEVNTAGLERPRTALTRRSAQMAGCVAEQEADTELRAVGRLTTILTTMGAVSADIPGCHAGARSPNKPVIPPLCGIA